MLLTTIEFALGHQLKLTALLLMTTGNRIRITCTRRYGQKGWAELALWHGVRGLYRPEAECFCQVIMLLCHHLP